MWNRGCIILVVLPLIAIDLPCFRYKLSRNKEASLTIAIHINEVLASKLHLPQRNTNKNDRCKGAFIMLSTFNSTIL